MNIIKFEKLLGKPISVFEEAIGDNFDNKYFNEYFYYNVDENVAHNFYGVSYNCISISTDIENKLQSITVHLQKTINRDFYDAFNKNYGMPKSILVIENRQLDSKSEIKDSNGKVIQVLKKNNFDLKEGNFEDNPLYIIWEINNYQIKAFLRHKQNISEITFSNLKN